MSLLLQPLELIVARVRVGDAHALQAARVLARDVLVRVQHHRLDQREGLVEAGCMPVGRAQQVQEAAYVIDLCQRKDNPMVGAVISGRPAIFKLYTYPKPFGTWDVWMYGASYHDGGKCFERGAVYQKNTGGEDMPGAQMRGQLGLRKAEVI